MVLCLFHTTNKESKYFLHAPLVKKQNKTKQQQQTNKKRIEELLWDAHGADPVNSKGGQNKRLFENAPKKWLLLKC